MPKKRREAETITTADARGRISLGPDAAGKPFLVVRDSAGAYNAIPVAAIPERELWLWQNQYALDSIRRGLEQAARGELVDLGSFEEYADEE